MKYIICPKCGSEAKRKKMSLQAKLLGDLAKRSCLPTQSQHPSPISIQALCTAAPTVATNGMKKCN